MSRQTIKAEIDANIKQNGNQEITGLILNSVLNQINDGHTTKVRVDITGTTGSYQFKIGNQVLNFQDLNNLLQVSPDFLVFVHGKREHRCTFIDLDSNPKQMRFVAPLLNENTLKTQSFYVTSNDGVAITSIVSSNINCENSSNKRSDLSNPNNTTYPTTKAVQDALIVRDTKLSELEEKTSIIEENLSEDDRIAIAFDTKEGLIPYQNSIASNVAFRLYYFKVKAGDKIKPEFTYNEAQGGAYYGYTDDIPALGSPLYNSYAEIYSSYAGKEFIASADGYYCVGLEFAYITGEVAFTKENKGIAKRLTQVERTTEVNTASISELASDVDKLNESLSTDDRIVVPYTKLEGLVCVGGDINSNALFDLFYIPIKEDDVIKVDYTTNEPYGTAYYAFTDDAPARGITIYNESGTLLNKDFDHTNITASRNGYLVISIEKEYLSGEPVLSKDNNGIVKRVERVEKNTKTRITIGVDGDFTTIKDGFEYAILHNIDEVFVKPGTYDLVAEGIADYTFPPYNNPNYKAGYYAPKKVIGYGAKLVCHLPNPSEDISPINLFYGSNGTEIYGLTIECSNCRYCIHDEMVGMSEWGSTYYRNVFKDLTLKFIGTNSAWAHNNNIGGGFGENGEVLIENCVMSSSYTKNIDYHSRPGGQSGNCKAMIKDCVLDKTITATRSGTSTSFLNKVYVTNCLCGSTIPSNITDYNMQLISWNNIVE